uniref:Eukaryotic translation initiation factor 2 subunit 2 n=1 Tax=Leptobrachium leishanense TaxID=445787 RepID=A0A8C5R0V0_9ANUR
MSGDEMIFDPTMSRKKKKKKKPFMLDEEGGEQQAEEPQVPETKEIEIESQEDKDTDIDDETFRRKDAPDDLDDLNFFNQKKKKKKTKKFDLDEAEEGVKILKIETEVQEASESQDDDLDFMLGKKKKKKNVKFPEEEDVFDKDEAFEEEDNKKDDEISFSSQLGPAWAGTERDYTYDELLNRVFNIMREKNPDMVAGEKRKFVMKPPQVVRVGTKKTSFVNFTDICKLLHRQPKHLLAFLLAELGTRGVRDVSHLSIARHDLTKGHKVIFPAVRDLPLALFGGQYQNRFPGCHRQESAAPCQSQLTVPFAQSSCFTSSSRGGAEGSRWQQGIEALSIVKN